MLIRADLGSHTTEKLITQLRSHLRTHSTTGHRILQELAAQLVAMLQQHSPPFTPFRSPRSPRSPSNEHELRIILITGVNGVGKTTTTGKLGYYFQQQGQKVVLCAADTFRAGAIDQLKVWGERLNLDVIATHQGADPAAVCYQGIEQAIKTKTDILVIDTAGRLHNKTNLMAELAKIQRVIKKLVPAAPHEIWLVVDGTTGQNATKQAHAFKEILPLTGLVITKLDGTAKGGAVVGISHQLKLPIRFIGLGEQAQDLSPFDATTYVAGLLHTDEIFTPQE